MLIALTLIGNLLGGVLVLFRIASLLACYLIFQLVIIGAVFWVFSQTEVSGLLLPFVVLGISSGVTMALSLTFMARAFPATIRYTGLATCYNIPVAIFGGTTLLVMTFISSQSLVVVPVYPVVFSVLSIGAVLLLWPRRHAISPFEGDDPDAPIVAYATQAEMRQS
ncbi:proline/glycine betaine transporter [compost metagenome]